MAPNAAPGKPFGPSESHISWLGDEDRTHGFAPGVPLTFHSLAGSRVARAPRRSIIGGGVAAGAAGLASIGFNDPKPADLGPGFDSPSDRRVAASHDRCLSNHL